MLKTQKELAIENIKELIHSLETGEDKSLFIDHIIDDVKLKERLQVVINLLEE